MELVIVGLVQSEFTPVEIVASVTDLPRGEGQLLGWKGSSMVVEAGSSSKGQLTCLVQFTGSSF
jgi:hypothetical protein